MPSFGLNNSDTNKNAVTPTSAPFITLSYFEYIPPSAGSNISIVDNFKSITNAIKDPVATITPDAWKEMTVRLKIQIIGTGTGNTVQLCPIVQVDNPSSSGNDPKFSYSLNADNDVRGIFREADTWYIDNLRQSLDLKLIPNTDTSVKDYQVFKFSTTKSQDELKSRGIEENKVVKLKFFGKISELSKKIEYTQYTLDFSYISSRGFGFGFEKKTLQGTSRKSIQQTKGLYGLDSVEGNLYVDTWGNAPDKITIGGKIEIPHGYDYPVKYTNGKLTLVGRQNNPCAESFIGTIEDFYQKNSNPLRVNRGEYLTLNDYYTGEFYIVTIKSRNFEESVDNPNIYSWSLELVVLQKIDIKSYQGAKVQNKGFLNTFF